MWIRFTALPPLYPISLQMCSICVYGKKFCAFDDAVKLKYINLNDIIQFNDFMMHIKREIDSLFLLRVLHFTLLPTFKVYFTIDQFRIRSDIPHWHTLPGIKTAIATVRIIDKPQYSIHFQKLKTTIAHRLPYPLIM